MNSSCASGDSFGDKLRRPSHCVVLLHTPLTSLMDLAKSRVAVERCFGGSFVGRSLPHHGSGADG